MCTKRRQTHCPPEWRDGELVDVRELAGLSSPWYFGAADDARYAEAFAQLTADGGFGAKWGLRTAERRHPCYNFSTNCVTSWHAPVWPFESSKLLTGLAALRPHAAAAAPRRDARRFADHAYVRADAHAWRRRGRRRACRSWRSFHPDDGFWLTAADVPAEDARREAARRPLPPSSTMSSPASSGSRRARRRRRYARRSSCSLSSPRPVAYVAATRVAVRGATSPSRGTATARGTAGEKASACGSTAAPPRTRRSPPPRGATALLAVCLSSSKAVPTRRPSPSGASEIVSRLEVARALVVDDRSGLRQQHLPRSVASPCALRGRRRGAVGRRGGGETR